MKSRNDIFLEVATGVFRDIQAAYPTYRGVVRDIQRLTRLVEERGQGVYLLDLPCLDDSLIRGLETGVLVLDGVPHSRVISKRIRVPRLASGLWLRIFDVRGCLLVEPDATAIFLLRTLLCLGKKIKVECSLARLKDTVSEYELIDSELPEPKSYWVEDCFPANTDNIRSVHLCDILDDLSTNPFALEAAGCERGRAEVLLGGLQRTADALAEALGPCDPEDLFRDQGFSELYGYRFKHGPGAVSDRPLKTKFSEFDKYEFPSWPAKLGGVFPYYPYGSHPEEVARHRVDAEPAAKLIAVAKTAKAPRLIASEPTAHQWCQQAVRSWLEKRLEKLVPEFITLKDQTLSAKLAQEASREGRLATVDLSSASDRLSLWAIERAFRRNTSLLEVIHAVRTRVVQNTIPGTETFQVVLRKAFSQGTAITFPVQSLFFLMCTLSVMPGNSISEKVKAARGKVRVYGDDIVVPVERYADLTALLSLVGLKVNLRKSFSQGYFRESCGGDYYRGYDVAPVKPKSFDPSTPDGRTALVDAANNFHWKGLWHTSKAIEDQLGRWAKTLPILGLPSGSLGLVSFCGDDVSHLAKRYNTHLCRYEYRIRTTSTTRRTVDRTGLLRAKEALFKLGRKASWQNLLFPELSNSEHVEVTGRRDTTRWEPLYQLS